MARVCSCLIAAVEACPVHRGDHLHAELLRLRAQSAGRIKRSRGVMGWLRRVVGQ
jgi:hypothetical protein